MTERQCIPTSYGISYFNYYANVVDEEYNKTNNFSLAKLVLYNKNFNNDGLMTKLSNKLQLDLDQTVSPISNAEVLKNANIHI